MTQRAALPPRIFEHLSQKQWGRAILLHELVDRRTFAFEDGTERTFREDFWDRMAQVAVPPEEAHRIERAARRGPPSAASGRSKAPPAKPKITFAQQLATFLAEYPVGFDDITYVRAERGEPETPGAERLKDAGVRHAQETLGVEALRARLEAGDFEGATRAAHDVLAYTRYTVSKGEASPLQDLEPERAEKVARALFELLHGEGPFGPRFDAFVASVGAPGTLTWPAATLLPALVHPDRHVFVKPSFFKKQALILDIDPHYEADPNSVTYQHLLDTAEEVRKRLKKAGQAPRDLLDVHAFVVRTLSSKAMSASAAG